MGTGVRDKYSLALNSKGYILKQAPDFPLYTKRVIQTQVDRLAISDIEYSDFSGANLFYVAQTDWSAGIKDQKKWLDDGKFLYSKNIDPYSEQGSLRLEKALSQKGTDLATGSEVKCSMYGEVNGSEDLFAGTTDADSDSKPRIYRFDADWVSVGAGAFAGTNQNIVSQMLSHLGDLWIFTVGVGNTEVVESWDGTTWTDHSAAIITAGTFANLSSSRCAASLGGTLYFGVDRGSSDEVALMSYDGATFTEEEYFVSEGRIVSIAAYGSLIYYLLARPNTFELRVFDPSTSVTTSVRTFENTTRELSGVGNKFLRVFKGNLIVTIPGDRIFSFNGSSLSLIFEQEELRDASDDDTRVVLFYGAVEKDNKLFWYNLIYDGEVFFNYKTGSDEGLDLVPLGGDGAGNFVYGDQSDLVAVYTDASTYKATDNDQFLVMSEMDQVSSIDKFLDSISIIFDELDAGTEIEIDYSINNRTTWTTLGSVNATDNPSQTKAEFRPTSNIQYNKIWIKVKLNTTNSANTPKVNDVILAYKPIPDFKLRWSFTLDASRQISLLNKQQEQRTGEEVKGELWNLMDLKQKVVFEDVDYFECTLENAMAVADTSAKINTKKPIPRSGRIRAVTSGYVEEMTFTSASNDKIQGITRAARGTIARAYAANVVLKNDYDAYVDIVGEQIIVTDENNTESRVQVVLTEA